MKLNPSKITYQPPQALLVYLSAERNFCESGNIPDKWDEEVLFEEEFN